MSEQVHFSHYKGEGDCRRSFGLVVSVTMVEIDANRRVKYLWVAGFDVGSSDGALSMLWRVVDSHFKDGLW